MPTLREDSASELKDAVRQAAAAGWLREDAARLLVELADAGIRWQGDISGCVEALGQRIAAGNAALANHPYQRFLNGGSKPVNAGGRPDFKVKDSYNLLKQSIRDLESLSNQLSEAFPPNDAATARQWDALNLALEAYRLLDALQSTATDTSGPQPALSADDYLLCLIWAGGTSSIDIEVNAEELTLRLGDYEARRLESARAAEICVSAYYTALGHTVEDVSIGQLTEGDKRWVNCDLIADQRHIDVKNARRSFSSPDAYVEHAVPAFKLARASGAEVIVVGALSDYLLSETAEGNWVRSVRILGEVKLTYLRRLFSWMRTRFGALLNLDKMWRPDYQPGWIFEYPAQHYPHRIDAIRRIPDFFRNAAKARLPREALAGWLTTLCPDCTDWTPRFLPSEHEKIRADLHALAADVGLARPSIYLYVMGYLLESMTRRLPVGDVEKPLRTSILTRLGNQESPKPLGLEDPQKYVLNLLDALVIVYKEVIERNLTFASFRLTHPEILRGLTLDGAWITLLAYCGGWRREPVRVKCGTTPLVLGRDEPCESCGYLVCHACGYCSQECGSLGKRQ